MEPLEPRALCSAAVVGREVFYNRSSFDGRSAAADERDLAAIAPDKSPLLPGASFSSANFTSYSRGINGIIVGIDGLAGAAPLTAEDFEFRLGNTADPASWKPAPAPKSVLDARPGISPAFARVTITLRDRAIRNTWLEVTVKATADTGLAAPDVFYFGNLIGDAGADGTVAEDDVAAARSALRGTAGLDAPADFDRSGRVTRADLRLARRNLGAALYTAGPFTPGVGAGRDLDPPALPGQWRLAFHDEFSSDSIDPVWHPAQYWDHDLTVVGGDELQAYDPSGVSASDGLLHLTARKDDQHGVPYVSGLVMTGGERAAPATPKFSFLYGYFEVRAKLPAGRGLWPAIWMMPASYNDDNGEVDVIELPGGDPSHATFALHTNHLDEVHEWDGPDLSREFHTYAVDWRRDRVTWYVDGVERARTTRPGLIPHEALYPILNLAVGGPSGTRPDDSTRFPASMDVDYVRVWQS